MGLDWRTLSLSSYMESLEAFNEMNDPEARPKGDQNTDRLAKFMKAHSATVQ